MRVEAELLIHQWIVAGSELASDKVIWARQNGPRPTETWISLRVLSDQSVGQNFAGLVDESGTTYETVHENSAISLSIQCYSGDATGIETPEKILARVRQHYYFPSLREQFRAARIAVGTFEAIQTVGTQHETSIFEPRAVMTIQLLSSDTLQQETTEWVESVGIENLDGVETVTSIPAP